jgi:hypothetical protein
MPVTETSLDTLELPATGERITFYLGGEAFVFQNLNETAWTVLSSHDDKLWLPLLRVVRSSTGYALFDPETHRLVDAGEDWRALLVAALR